jgi:glyoxylase-like metal-dependent hydrolase (beta-lactamase superfamily II)
MAFLTEPPPAPGVPIHTAPGIRRLVAPNPGPMTYHGTNTWLIDEPDGVVVIDPGPDDACHVRAIQDAAGQRIRRILVTHTHPDHVGAVPALRAATGAPVAGFAKPWAAGFAPDVTLAESEPIGSLVALHTPGHASDHLCFAHASSGSLFSGDHVMSWNTSIVALPDGDMAAYMANLRRLLPRGDMIYFCGHGPPLPEPQKLVRAMLGHRLAREAAIVAAISDESRNAAEITSILYAALSPNLAKAARLTVEAHLAKLQGEDRVRRQDDAAWLTV